MSPDVVGRVVDVGGGLRHEPVEHGDQILGDALFVGEDRERARRVLSEEGTGAIAHRGHARRDIRGDVDDFLTSFAVNDDAAHVPFSVFRSQHVEW